MSIKQKNTKCKSSFGKGNEARIVERQRVTSPNDVTEQQKLMHFINNFSFPKPDWSTLPDGFPNLKKNGLSKEEGHILDGIKLAWLTSEGRDVLYRTVGRRVVLGVAVVIFAIFLGRNLVIGRDAGITRSVSAKTVSQAVGEIIESTMSAVFRK